MHASQSDGHDHSPPQDPMQAHDHSVAEDSESHECDPAASACECAACVHFVGLVSLTAEPVAASMLFAAGLPTHYVEPTYSPAFRPPILI